MLPGSLTAGTRTWYGLDAQGSIRQTLTDTGNVTSVQNYDPFGSPETTTLGTTFGYAGQLQDPTTGAEYLRARWYQPSTGQLLGVDPALAQTGLPYAYAGDNPVNFADPSGLDCQWGPFTLPFGSTGQGSCVQQGADAVTSAVSTGVSTLASTGATVVQTGVTYAGNTLASGAHVATTALTNAASATSTTVSNTTTTLANTGRRLLVPTLYWTSAELAALNHSQVSTYVISALTPGCVPGMQVCELKSPAQIRAQIYGMAVGTVGLGDTVAFGLPSRLLTLLGIPVPDCSKDYQTGQVFGSIVNYALLLASLGGDSAGASALSDVDGAPVQRALPGLGVEDRVLGQAGNSSRLRAANQGNVFHYDELNGGPAGSQYGPSQLAQRYPQTNFKFARLGQTGADIKVFAGAKPWDLTVYPTSRWPTNFYEADFKPNWEQFERDVLDGKKDPNTTFAILYDANAMQLLLEGQGGYRIYPGASPGAPTAIQLPLF